MSESSNIQVRKPHDKAPHDVLGDADKASMAPNGRQRMQAIFETVSQQIKLDIERARAAASQEEAVAIFETTYNEYMRNRNAVIDKLDRVVTK